MENVSWKRHGQGVMEASLKGVMEVMRRGSVMEVVSWKASLHHFVTPTHAQRHSVIPSLLTHTSSLRHSHGRPKLYKLKIPSRNIEVTIASVLRKQHNTSQTYRKRVADTSRNDAGMSRKRRKRVSRRYEVLHTSLRKIVTSLKPSWKLIATPLIVVC